MRTQISDVRQYRTVICRILPALLLVAVHARAQHGANYDESKMPAYVLPELLTTGSGESIADPKSWEAKRRPEILELFSTHVFGHTPKDKIRVRYETVEEKKDDLGGKATRKQVGFVFSNGKKEIEALLLMYIPNHVQGKVPVFVGYNFKGNHSTIADSSVLYSPSLHLVKEPGHPDWIRGNQSHRWSFAEIIDRGYAVATMCYHDIYPDKKELRDQSIVSLFPGYRPDSIAGDEWQALGAWAWGSARIADYLETENRIDPDRMAIIGHSRQGMAALWAGAQEPRFKVVIANNAGEGAAAITRRRYGETIAIQNTLFPHWNAPNYRKYNDHEDSLPVDFHQLVALMAPRAVYIASAEEDRWADPKGEFLAAYHAGPAFRLYGLDAIDTDVQPPLHSPIMRQVGYHIRAGKHDVTAYDWSRFLDFADLHFKKTD